jgi:hypothetical protein
MYYNFVRIHQTLKVSPAMAAGVTDRLWEMTDLVGNDRGFRDEPQTSCLEIVSLWCMSLASQEADHAAGSDRPWAACDNRCCLCSLRVLLNYPARTPKKPGIYGRAFCLPHSN